MTLSEKAKPIRKAADQLESQIEGLLKEFGQKHSTAEFDAFVTIKEKPLGGFSLILGIDKTKNHDKKNPIDWPGFL